MTLEDRIYCLKQTHLPDELQVLLIDADESYVNHKDFKATLLVTVIENECLERGISIYMPVNINSSIAEAISSTAIFH